MSDTITNAKEIYYSFRDEHGTRHVVPVRGVYVTGEWKPPLYMEPILRVIEFNTNSITIEDYIETEVDHEDMSSIHLYDAGVNFGFGIDWYTSAENVQPPDMGTIHLYDAGMDTSFNIDWYTSTKYSHEDMSSIHLYDVGADLSFNMTFFSTCIGGSFPEPVLRLIEFNTTASTIEDYNE